MESILLQAMLTSMPEDADATATNAVATILGIVKEVAEMLKDVPCGKGLVGVILQIIKIKGTLSK